MATKLDPALTKQLQDWLNAVPQDRDLMAGAQLLLKLNRNRAFYNTVVRRREKYAAKLEYELKKFLRIRLDGLTQSQVAEMEKKVLPSAMQIIDTADELPEAQKAKGRRPDHDLLPDSIKALWDDNLRYYKQINLLFEELKAMNNLQPCDRYDKLQMLASADSKYRANLAEYDSYVVGSESAPVNLTEVNEDNAKRINAARKTISKFRSRLNGSAQLTAEAKAAALDALQRNVNTVIECGGGFSEDTKSELSSWGITF